MVTRAPTTLERPAGISYEAGFLTDEEQHTLVAAIEALDFREVVMRGQVARRTVRHFGYDYDYDGWKLVPGEPLPEELEWVRERAAAFGGVELEELAQTLVSRYPEKATIGWHRDAPMFGEPVVGVSLGSPARMRLQRKTSGERRLFELELESGSAYALSGPARWSWQHSIPPTKGRRYSVTFRTLRQRTG
jgi:DNA oxidative demethylase